MVAGPPPDPLFDRVRAATAGEYVIEGELGRGGMAAVYLGRDVALHRRVAIKVMLPEMARVAGSQERFVVEARTAAQLDHPGIVTIYAVKQSGGLTFIVMKYIEGQTLDHVLATRGPLDSGVVAAIGSHVAQALQFAHSHGVVHRDVKPSNIIIDTTGHPVVADFGIAKVSTSPSLTMAGATLGTPAYMCPEQCLGLPVTPASDQYSLGVVLYQLLTGRVPFSGRCTRCSRRTPATLHHRYRKSSPRSIRRSARSSRPCSPRRRRNDFRRCATSRKRFSRSDRAAAKRPNGKR